RGSPSIAVMTRLTFLASLVFGTTLLAQTTDTKIKVACVGDSITAGARLKDPLKAYPAQLGALLGEKYEVKNFGNSGSTMLDEGNKPYKKQKSFADAIAFVPDIVVIKLGTNDSKPLNWEKKEGFAASAKALVAAFQKANAQVKVYLCYPVPVIAQGNFGIRNEIVKPEIIPLLQQVATEMKLEVIDL
ncbi:MAG: GDSL-type esterase/lipase family protein, partial [Roseimicrobium sp.]